MSIELDPQEVLEHLYSLGYCNITKEQLKDFIKDLQKLIKYDLRKEEKRHHLHHDNLYKPNKENVCECIHLSPNKDIRSPTKVSVPTVPNIRKKALQPSIQQCSTHCSHLSPERNLPSSYSRNVQHSPVKETCYSSGESPVTCTHNGYPCNKAPLISKVCCHTVESADKCSSSEECIQVKHPARRKEKPSSSRKPLSSVKPCPSFIRPGSSKGNIPKGDPVALYHYYKTLWSQHTLPGESSHEDLRWRIRHKMMAPPVINKGQAEEKSTKRPEWMCS